MANSFNGTPAIQHTLTALNRWSVAEKQLPREGSTLEAGRRALTEYSCCQCEGSPRL